MVSVMLKFYKSIVNNEIQKEIHKAEWAEDLIQYGIYKCDIDGLIAAGALFCPELVCMNDYVLIRQFMNCTDEDIFDYVNELEEIYHYSKKEIEMCVNSWSIADLFINSDAEIMKNENVINQFAEMLSYFWKMRVKQLFPEKNIVVELGNEIMGELGMCITMYEKEQV